MRKSNKELSPLDNLLIEGVRKIGRLDSTIVLRRKGDDKVEINLGVEILCVDPASILRSLLSSNELSEMLDEDHDYGPKNRVLQGKLRGGKKGERDDHFGLDEKFWDWWHLQKKRHNLGRDIETQKEADTQHDIYRASCRLIRASIFYDSIRRLSYAQQALIRAILLDIATTICIKQAQL